MVNKPSINPYFWGVGTLRGGKLTAHKLIFLPPLCFFWFLKVLQIPFENAEGFLKHLGRPPQEVRQPANHPFEKEKTKSISSLHRLMSWSRQPYFFRPRKWRIKKHPKALRSPKLLVPWLQRRGSSCRKRRRCGWWKRWSFFERFWG